MRTPVSLALEGSVSASVYQISHSLLVLIFLYGLFYYFEYAFAGRVKLPVLGVFNVWSY